jgi:hypothetical protein
MRTRFLLVATLVAALALPSVAAAKGPASATVSGPGLDRALPIAGQGELGSGTPLGSLVDAGGFFAQMYGQAPDPTRASRPEGTLGRRYEVVYVVPGPDRISSRTVQSVYPYAKPTPLTYMRAGQSFWGSQKTHGGWFQASPALKRTLVAAGLPATEPRATGGFPSARVTAASVAGVLVLLSLVGVTRTGRRRGWGRARRVATG